MEPTLHYQIRQDFLVSSADVDFQQKLRLSSLTNFLIQVAWRHAEHLGWGTDDLHKHNLVWVLSGMQIELDKYPVWRDSINIETWPKGINRLYYLRDFLIRNQQGDVIGRATSNWLLIDIERRRPRQHDLNNEVFRHNLTRNALEELIAPSPFQGKVEKELPLSPRFSDIDLNHHLTTTRYVDWMFDTFSPDDIAQERAKGILLNFNKEVVYDQQVVMQRSEKAGNKIYFQLIDSKRPKAIFNATLTYSSS
jgi:medium-chain acyl-[acyl-carrier-protein] hydrolase